MFILYKGKGDPLLPSSYRAIALLEAFVKLYERLLCHRLQEWAREKEIIPPCQFGFRKASGTLDAVFVFWKLVEFFVTIKKRVLFAALIDFKSAFPSVDRSLLFKRLADLGVSKKFGCALHSLFEGNTFQLRLGNGITKSFPVTTGLKEGSVLSPLLFSIFIADIEHEVLGPQAHLNFLHGDCFFQGVCVNGLLFADDLVIFSTSQRGLRHRLHLLEKYTTRKRLTVNTSKCEIVAFGAPLNAVYSFRFGNSAVPVVRRCKYLGVYFDQNTFLGAYADSLVAGFRNALGAFFRLGRKLKLSELSTWAMLQTSLLFSVLYGIELLDVDISDQLASCYRGALRAFIGLPNKVSNEVLDLLFPEFSFELFFVRRKHGFLRRSALHVETLAAIFFMEDRVHSLPAGHGFSFNLQSHLRRMKVEELAWTVDKSLASFGLRARQEALSEAKWVKMAAARSTRFVAVVFGARQLWHDFLSVAAGRNRACLRACLLTWTGSIGVSVGHKPGGKCPFCPQTLDSRHPMLCGHPPGFQLELVAMARRKKWPALLRLTLDVYFRFLFFLRPSVLSEDEGMLVDWDERPV
jgi:hypothetical protein